MTDGQLFTRRLLLRSMTQADLPVLQAAWQEGAEKCGEQRLSSEQQEQDANDPLRQACLGPLAVCLKSTGQVIGQCGLVWREIPGAESVGTAAQDGRVLMVTYALAGCYRHQGYAAEAACACRDWAFQQAGADALCALVKQENHPAHRVVLRLGMKRIEWPSPSGRELSLLYAITRAQWLRLKGRTPEVWDVYDHCRRRTGATVYRGSHMAEGRFFMGVAVTVLTPDGKVLLTLRSPEKKQAPNTWEVSGGAALSGESAPEAASRELCEETGLLALPEELIYLGAEWQRSSFMEQFLLRRDVDVSRLTLQPGETCDARLLDLEQALTLAKGGHLEGRALCAPVARRLRTQAPLLRRALAGQPLWPDGQAPRLGPDKEPEH